MTIISLTGLLLLLIHNKVLSMHKYGVYVYRFHKKMISRIINITIIIIYVFDTLLLNMQSDDSYAYKV